MRVERFSLFFPPLLAARRRSARPSTRIGADPARRLREDQRDEAGRGPPGRGPRPRLPRAAGVEADRGDRRGPGGQPGARVRPAVLLLRRLRPARRATGRRHDREGLSRPPACCSPATGSSPSTASAATPTSLREQVAAHKCAGSRREGCKAAEPVTVVVERDGKRAARRAHADLRRRRRGDAARLRATRRTTGPVPFGEALDISVDRFWFVTKRDGRRSRRRSSTPRSASRSPAWSAPTRPRARRSSTSPRDVVAILALISLSLAIVNLFPFLPLDGGHIFWAIVEKVRRKPVHSATMERASIVGFVLVRSSSSSACRTTSAGFRRRLLRAIVRSRGSGSPRGSELARE